MLIISVFNGFFSALSQNAKLTQSQTRLVQNVASVLAGEDYEAPGKRNAYFSLVF